MKTLKQRLEIAGNAISTLESAVLSKNKSRIIHAYDIVKEDIEFSWHGLDDSFNEWNDLVDKANDILYS